MNTKLNIRRVRSDEVETLRDLSVSTFIDTYDEYNTAENMKNYIARSFDMARLQRELGSHNVEYYFAEIKDEIVGYLRLNYREAQTNQSIANACEIERIYVAPEHKGQKIGKALFEKSVACAREASLEWVWLGVWDQNTKAIAFYKKWDLRFSELMILSWEPKNNPIF